MGTKLARPAHLRHLSASLWAKQMAAYGGAWMPVVGGPRGGRRGRRPTLVVGPRWRQTPPPRPRIMTFASGRSVSRASATPIATSHALHGPITLALATDGHADLCQRHEVRRSPAAADFSPCLREPPARRVTAPRMPNQADGDRCEASFTLDSRCWNAGVARNTPIQAPTSFERRRVVFFGHGVLASRLPFRFAGETDAPRGGVVGVGV